MQQEPDVVLLAPRHAAKRLGISTSRITQLDREGILPAMRDSAGRRFYDPVAVERVRKLRAAARIKAAGRSDG